MIKLLLLATVLTVVGAKVNVLEKYVGTITPVMKYPKERDMEYCFSLDIAMSNSKCECNGAAVPALDLTVYGETTAVPIVIIESETEVQDALKEDCTCDKRNGLSSAILPFNENYFIVYGSDSENKISATILFAKNKPTPKELSDFINSEDELKNKSGDVICTTDTVDVNEDAENKESKAAVSTIKQVFVKH